eukprot:1008493-Amphidinium_carterae.1
MKTPPIVTNYHRAIEWLEEFSNKLTGAIQVKSKVQPQEVHQVVVCAMNEVCSKDIVATIAWNDEATTSTITVHAA